MALRCESTVTVPGTPEAVFPWLLEEEKVPRWMSGLERYEQAQHGPLRVGSRIHEELNVSGQRLRFEMELTVLDPPRRAELRFEGSGFRAVNRYAVAATDGGSRVTWVVEGDATSFSARFLVRVVQSRLQEKLDGDLARLRNVLGAEAAAA